MTQPPKRLSANALLAFAVILVSVGYLYTVTYRCYSGLMSCVDNTNPLTSPAPFRYRILAPTIANVFGRSVIADAAVHAFLVALLLPGLYLWLKRWVDSSRALLGVCIVCMVFMLSFEYYMPYGTTIIELVLLVYALNVIDRSFAVYAFLLVLSAVNRETSLLLVAVYAAWHGRAGLSRAGILLLIWAGITLGLHVVLGAAPHIYGLQNTLERNVAMLPEALTYNAPFIALWLLCLARYRSAPSVLKRFMVISVVYALAVLVGAMWAEIRVLLPVFPLVLPLILKY